MLTKDDLQAIQRMFDSSKKETNERFVNVDNKIVSLSNTLQKNTEDLIELITTGFNAQDAGFNRTDKILINHEKRIGTLEKTIFKTN